MPHSDASQQSHQQSASLAEIFREIVEAFPVSTDPKLQGGTTMSSQKALMMLIKFLMCAAPLLWCPQLVDLKHVPWLLVESALVSEKL